MYYCLINTKNNEKLNFLLNSLTDEINFLLNLNYKNLAVLIYLKFQLSNTLLPIEYIHSINSYLLVRLMI